LAEAEEIFLGQDHAATSAVSRSLIAWQRLRLLPRLINQAVGDALSDLLFVDAILSLQNWTFIEWDSMYQDLPSRQCKIRVRDRKVVETNHDETKVLAPLSLQQAIDQVVSSLESQDNLPVRAFVRPSGTEDVVRVYAEAPTQSDADNLAYKVASFVYDLCAGVGDRPILSLV
jgi:phosphoacetylglucosamine mutase